jgi:hypothetical protein
MSDFDMMAQKIDSRSISNRIEDNLIIRGHHCNIIHDCGFAVLVA